MQINFYDESDNELGTVTFLGWNKWGDEGWESEDFSKKQIDFLVSIVEKRGIRDYSTGHTIHLTDEEMEKLQKIS